MTKIILTDVDDAILDWTTPFVNWVREQGRWSPISENMRDCENIEKWLNVSYEETRDIIIEFNDNPDIWPNFKALPGAKEAVSRLVDDGYTFVAITACDPRDWAYQGRLYNLRKEFGGAFDTLHCVGLGGCKKSHLARYRPAYWVEDKWSHAVDGADLGHRSFLMRYNHNEHHVDDRITRVSNWSEISNMILSGNHDIKDHVIDNIGVTLLDNGISQSAIDKAKRKIVA